MTAATAPGGLKLTEEHEAVAGGCHYRADRFTEQLSNVAWRPSRAHIEGARNLLRNADTSIRTLRAERDAKDAEIARLKEEVAAREEHYRAVQATWFELLEATKCSDGGELQDKAERATRAEARLAAMASVTEAEVEAGCRAFAIKDGMDPEQFEPHMICGPNNEYRPVWQFYAEGIRAALEAFVVNKTEGGT